MVECSRHIPYGYLNLLRHRTQFVHHLPSVFRTSFYTFFPKVKCMQQWLFAFVQQRLPSTSCVCAYLSLAGGCRWCLLFSRNPQLTHGRRANDQPPQVKALTYLPKREIMKLCNDANVGHTRHSSRRALIRRTLLSEVRVPIFSQQRNESKWERA